MYLKFLALESEFNPDGAIDVITMYDGLGGTVEWEGLLVTQGNYIDNLLPEFTMLR